MHTCIELYKYTITLTKEMCRYIITFIPVEQKAPRHLANSGRSPSLSLSVTNTVFTDLINNYAIHNVTWCSLHTTMNFSLFERVI